MAEGWTRYLKGDLIQAHSAGMDPESLIQSSYFVSFGFSFLRSQANVPSLS